MKKELSSVELSYVIKELQFLIGSKVDSIYQASEKDIYLQLFKSGDGKHIIRILPNFIYLTKKKQTTDNPMSFCMYLRKHLEGARLAKIEQKDSERLVDMTFTTKSATYHLMIELFSTGNMIVCDKEYKVLNLVEKQQWKDRELRQNVPYQAPPAKASLFALAKPEFSRLLEGKELVKALAGNIGLGGVLAEELCARTGLDKSKRSVSGKELDRLYDSFEGLIRQKPEPRVISKDDKTIDAVPFALEKYASFTSVPAESFNLALDLVVTPEYLSAKEQQKQATYAKKAEKLQAIIDQQRKKKVEIEEEIKEQEMAAELIYSNYAEITEIINGFNKALETMSWAEITKKIKNKKIKDINPKDKTISVELD